MADVARLGLSVDSAPVKEGKRALDDLTNAAGRAERAGGGLKNAFSRLEQALASIEVAVRDVENAVKAMGTVSDRAGGSLQTLSGYSVKLSGSLNVVDGNASAAGSALQKMATDAARASTSQSSAAAAADNLAGRTLAVSKATEAEVRNLIQMAAASQRATKATDAEAQSLLTRLAASQRAARGARDNTDAIEEEVRALLQLAAANRKVPPRPPAANDNRLRQHELTNLMYQANDAVTMWGSGSSFQQIVATQAGQVYQVLAGAQGGVSGALKDIGARLMALVTPGRLALGGLATLAIGASLALASVSSQTKEMNRALMGTGAATQASAAELLNISQAASNAAEVSGESARGLVSVYTRTGKIGTDMYVGLTEAAAGYAYVTGQELPDAGAKLAEAFADPARGVMDLDKALNFLDQTTLDYIRSAAISGNRTEAQRVMLERLTTALPTAADRTNGLARAWDAVWRAAEGAAGAIGKAMSANGGRTPEEQLSNVQKRIAELMSQDDAVGSGGVASQARKRRQKELEESLALERKLLDQIAATAKAQQDADDRAKLKAGTVARESTDPRIGQLRDLLKTQSDLRNALDVAARTGGNTDQWLGDLNNVGDQIAALTKNGKDLIPVLDQMRERATLLANVNAARNDNARIAAQQALDLFDERSKGTPTAVANATAENNAYQAQIQLQTQLSLASRARMSAAEEAVAAAHAEATTIGLTAGEQAELNANRQAELTLRREAEQTGGRFDEAELSRLKAKNVELREAVNLRAQRQLESDMGFDARQLGRSDMDQQVASSLRSYGLAEDLSGANAAMLRLNMTMRDFRSATEDAFGGLVNELMNSTSLTDGLANALKRIGNQLANKAVSSIVGGLFGSMGGMFGGGSLFGGGGGAGFNDSMWGFAEGGVMTPQGPRRLEKFARGGVSRKAAIFGEAGPEAAVPLPDGRRIPVDLNLGPPAARQAAPVPLVVHINNNAPVAVRAEQKQTPDGPRLDVTVDEMQAGNTLKAGSRTQKSMARAYGLTPQTAMR
ncbi:phage tail length tape measure family protein [Xanthobacteraceae bacterium A53D]